MAITVGAVALGAMLGLGSFIVGVGLIGDTALLIALLGPPLAVWLIYKLRGFQLVVMSVVGIGTALAVVLLAAGGYNT